MWALIVRVFAFALARRWAFRRDGEITGSGQVGEQVTAVTLVRILDGPGRDAPKPPSNGPPRFCHVQ